MLSLLDVRFECDGIFGKLLVDSGAVGSLIAESCLPPTVKVEPLPSNLKLTSVTMRLGLNGLETGDAGIRTRARFQPVYALVQARTR